jgi:hypothetical protein
MQAIKASRAKRKFPLQAFQYEPCSAAEVVDLYAEETVPLASKRQRRLWLCRKQTGTMTNPIDLCEESMGTGSTECVSDSTFVRLGGPVVEDGDIALPYFIPIRCLGGSRALFPEATQLLPANVKVRS